MECASSIDAVARFRSQRHQISSVHEAFSQVLTYEAPDKTSHHAWQKHQKYHDMLRPIASVQDRWQTVSNQSP